MLSILLTTVLFGNFIQKWYLPIGCAIGSTGRILVGDTDRDGCCEIFISDFQGFEKINVCELHLPDTWVLDSFQNNDCQFAWDIGDFDCDGLNDLLQVGWDSLGLTLLFFVTESLDSNSYPTIEVWRDTTGPAATQIGDEAFDIDQDGYPELVKNEPEPYNLGLYEYQGDNQYALIFADTTSYGGPIGTHAFGDFDQDGHNEVVFGGGRAYWIYESPANDTYERLRFDTLPTANIIDCRAVPDADGDGKWEFVLKGAAVFGTIDAFIFEASGNNMYDTIKVFQFPGGDYAGGFSDAGDVDGDSIPEIVLEARQTVYIIKAAANDSFYVWQTLPGNPCGMNIKIFDLDNNGMNDIIMSTAQQTWIYEWLPGQVNETAIDQGQLALEIIPNPAKNIFKIKYGSADETIIRITLHDITGRKIENLFDGKSKVGMNQITVKPENLSSGIYFVRLESEYNKKVEKVILLE